MADRRAAFLAAERARTEDSDESRPEESASGAPRRTAVFIREKSIATAYILWFFLGGISAHRFYLGAVVSGIVQIALWYVSLMFWMAGHDWAFYSLGAGWIWIAMDFAMIPQLRGEANERARKRAEMLVLETVSS